MLNYVTRYISVCNRGNGINNCVERYVKHLFHFHDSKQIFTCDVFRHLAGENSSSQKNMAIGEILEVSEFMGLSKIEYASEFVKLGTDRQHNMSALDRCIVF